MMGKKLINWIKDSETFETIRSFHMKGVADYEFVARQEDFYVSLLHHMFCLMNHLYDSNVDQVKRALLEVAKGILLYSDKNTQEEFYGVNRINNQLYVAAIYYLCDYDAVAKLMLKGMRREMLGNQSAQMIYMILSGFPTQERQMDNDDDIGLVGFIESGDYDWIDPLLAICDKRCKIFDFEDANDFYMTFLYRHVLKRFRNNNIWIDLLKYGERLFWMNYVKQSLLNEIVTLLPSQKDAIEKGLLTFERSFSLQMPTSSGKSYITELLIYQELERKEGTKVLYLAPLRSLSRELRERFKSFCHFFNYNFAAKYGGSASSISETGIDDARLLIATPEMFITLEGADDSMLEQFSLVICDEGQLLDDYSRGVNYELLLTRLRKRDNIRFLFISAIIPNIGVINEWLGGDSLQVGNSQYRPSKIRLALLEKNGDSVNLHYYDEWYENEVAVINEFVTRDEAGTKFKSVKNAYCATAIKALEAGQVMVFASVKGGNSGCKAIAETIYNIAKSSSKLHVSDHIKYHKRLCKIVEYLSYQLGDDYSLVSYIKEGVAYHHGDLPQDIREQIEYAYGSQTLPLIVCTGTLAEGVNFPIKTLVLANIQDPASMQGKKILYLNAARLKNIIGRVGRAGRERYGTVILPDNDKGVAKWLVQSALKNEHIDNVRGSLFALIRDLSHKEEWDHDGTIEEWLSESNLVAAIDLMISRNAQEDTLENVDIKEIITESLAYALGSEVERKMLTRVFQTRYDYLRNHVTGQRYRLFKKSGFSVEELDEVEETIDKKMAELFRTVSDVTTNAWIHSVVTYIMDKESIQKEIRSNYVNSMVPYICDKELVENVLKGWIKCNTYQTISDATNVDIDILFVLIGFVQSRFLNKLQSLIAYICERYDIENGRLQDFIDMVRYGVDSKLKIVLRGRGLSDRYALKAVEDYANQHEILYLDDYDMANELASYSSDIADYMKKEGMPIICIEHLRRGL